jgi:hypothetical protein
LPPQTSGPLPWLNPLQRCVSRPEFDLKRDGSSFSQDVNEPGLEVGSEASLLQVPSEPILEVERLGLTPTSHGGADSFGRPGQPLGASLFFVAASPDAQGIFRRVQGCPLMNYSPEVPEGKDSASFLGRFGPVGFVKATESRPRAPSRPLVSWNGIHSVWLNQDNRHPEHHRARAGRSARAYRQRQALPSPAAPSKSAKIIQPPGSGMAEGSTLPVADTGFSEPST